MQHGHGLGFKRVWDREMGARNMEYIEISQARELPEAKAL